MELLFHPLSQKDAEEIARWCYEGDYSVYNTPIDKVDSAIRYMLDPNNGFLGAHRGAELIGFCSIGHEGQVPGGAYDDSASDLGAGMRPDLVGRGSGASFLQAALAFIESDFGQRALRATIASWNQRAIRTAQAVGFVPYSSFTSHGGMQFTIFIRVEGAPNGNILGNPANAQTA